MSTEHAHQVGRFLAGRIPSRREELRHLRTAAEQARMNFERHRSHANEIERGLTDQRIEDFLAANPQLSGAAS